jgi:hypothetical protein
MSAIINCTGRSQMALLPALQTEILQSFGLHDDVVAHVDGVEAADLGFVQLIESARLHAARNGKSLRLATPAPAPLRDLLDAAGLLAQRSPDTLAFWCHEEDAR